MNPLSRAYAMAGMTKVLCRIPDATGKPQYYLLTTLELAKDDCVWRYSPHVGHGGDGALSMLCGSGTAAVSNTRHGARAAAEALVP